MFSSIINFLKPAKKARKRLTYEDFIIAAARNSPDFTITAVHSIKILQTLPMQEGTYAEIAETIKRGDMAQLLTTQKEGDLLEELTLIQFANQADEPFAAIVYDGYNAWEYPVVVEIFKL